MNTYALIATALLAALAFSLQLGQGFASIDTGWGMKIDLVAVPILLAFLIFGYESAFYCAILLALFITFFSGSGFIGAVMKISATLPMFVIPALFVLATKKKTDYGKVAALLVFGILATLAVFAASGYAGLFLAPVSKEAAGLATVVVLIVISIGFLWIWRNFGQHVEISAMKNPLNASLALALAVVVRGVAMIVANIYFAGPLFFKISSAQLVQMIESVPFPLLGKGVPFYFVIFFWNVVQAIVEFSIAWVIAYKFSIAEKYGSK